MTVSANFIDELGDLVSVSGRAEFTPEKGSPRYRFDEYVLQFQGNRLAITANAEDDTIVISDKATLEITVDLTHHEPWRKLIGCGVIWAWQLENHRGYKDGYQIELGRPGQILAIQFMSEGGGLSVYSLVTIDGLLTGAEG